MTGEMFKPPDAEKGEEYWKGRTGVFGGYVLGDDAYLIRPNYPEVFKIAEILKKKKIESSVNPFDVYQGPYVGIGPYSRNGKIWGSDRVLGEYLLETKKGKFFAIDMEGIKSCRLKEGRLECDTLYEIEEGE